MLKWEFTYRLGTVVQTMHPPISDMRTPRGSVGLTLIGTRARVQWEQSDTEEVVNLAELYRAGDDVAVVYTAQNKHAADVNLMTGRWKLNPLKMSLGGVVYAIVSLLLIAAGGIGVLMLIGGFIYAMVMGASDGNQVEVSLLPIAAGGAGILLLLGGLIYAMTISAAYNKQVAGYIAKGLSHAQQVSLDAEQPTEGLSRQTPA